jgi:hypothetical protein
VYGDDEFAINDVEEVVRQLDSGDVNTPLNNDQVHVLDQSITIDETLSVLAKMKLNKSAGLDGLIPELFVHNCDVLAPVLCSLLNFLFDNAVYPQRWANGIIVPVHKKK